MAFCQYLDPAEPGLLDLLSAILQALRQQTASWLALDVSDEGNGAWPWYGKGLYKAAAKWAPCRLSMPPGAGRT